MTKTCPACGFVSGAQARFCRNCGALLARANESDDQRVSPHAATVPLSDLHLHTDPLASHDTGLPNPARTSDLLHNELDELLRRSSVSASHPVTDDASSHEPNADASTHDANAENVDSDDSADGSRPLRIRVRPIESEAQPETTLTSTTRNASAQLATAETERAETTRASVSSPANALDELSSPTEARALRVWAGTAALAVVALIIASCVVLAWYVVRRVRNSGGANEGASVTTTSNTDAKRAAAAKLKEADELINDGRADEATARLREAAALDPTDAEPHRRLARLLTEGGARRMAITELQTVVRLAPEDAQARRDLEAAQSAVRDER